MNPDHRLARCSVLALSMLALASPGAAAAAEWGEASVRLAAHSYEVLERKDVERLAAALDVLVADPGLVEAFRARDRDRLLALAQPRFERLKAELSVTHWYFIEREPARTCFLRVHAPATFSDVIRRDTLSQAIATGRMGAGKELGKTAFALRVVKPIRLGGEVIGYMELGEEIDHFLGRMKEETGDDYAVLVDKAHIDRKELARVRGEDRWNERKELVLIDATMPSASRADVGVPLAALPRQGRVTGEWAEGGLRYVGGAFPISTAAGHVVGALFVRHLMRHR
jgi:hypothetical protein